jgi:hypothetical protein
MYNLTAQIQLQAPNNAEASRVVNQINRQLQGVSVDIRLNANNRQMQQTAQNINSIGKNARSSASQVNSLGQAFGTATRRFGAVALVTGSFLALTRGIRNSLSEAIKFEREVLRISQVTGKTTSQLSGLVSEVGRLATGLGVSSSDILKTARILSQAGFAADEVTRALKVLAQTTLAPTFDSIADTTEGAIALLNQFRSEAAATGDEILFLEKSLGAINEISKRFAVESSDLISVVRRTGGVFEAAGGKLNELLALFTSVRSTTRESADTIATGFRTIFTRIQRVETIESLKALGIELSDVEGKFVGPLEAIKRLSTGLRALDPRDFRFNQIVEDLGGFRQIGKVIPLIKEFRVSTEALAAAQEGQNSISADAEKAQQALEVRIEKVQEKFKALFRTLLDSEGFRAIVDVSLKLAEALIKVGESLVPLVPLLTTFAGIKLGGALTGFSKGLLGRNSGGPIGFASGGTVPGVGNGDTVPAMLTPGEFVIRKSSVESIGAENLARMNSGGSVQRFTNGGGTTGSTAKTRGLTVDEAVAKGFNKSTITSGFGKDASDAAFAKKGNETSGEITGIQLRKRFGISFLDGNLSGPVKSTINSVLTSGNKTGAANLRKVIKGKSVRRGAALEAPNAVPGFLDPSGKEIFKREIEGGIVPLFDKATKDFNGELNPGEVPLQKLISKSGIESIKGQFFEAFVRRVSGNIIQDESSTDAIFDFKKSNNKAALLKLFGGIFQEPNEFKNSPTGEAIPSSIGKAFAEIGSSKPLVNISGEPKQFALGGSIQKFRDGGSPADTVPALLTPGEFVINAEKASEIGSHRLNDMNRNGIQGFNRGGSVGVQRFSRGSSGSGVKASSGGGLNLNDLSTKLLLFGGIVASTASSMLGLEESTEKATNAALSTATVYFAIGQQVLSGVRGAFDKLIGTGAQKAAVDQQEIASGQAVSATANQAAVSLAELSISAQTAAVSNTASSGSSSLSFFKSQQGPVKPGAPTGSFLSKSQVRGAKSTLKFKKALGGVSKALPVLQGALIGFTIGSAIAAAKLSLLNSSLEKSVGAFDKLYTDLKSGEIDPDGFKNNARESDKETKKTLAGIERTRKGTSGKAIGGGVLAGAGIGAAIGSVVPVVGTAIGGAIGAAVGGIGVGLGGDKLVSADISNEAKAIDAFTTVLTLATGGVSEYQRVLNEEKEKLAKGQELSFESLDKASKELDIDKAALFQAKSVAEVNLAKAQDAGVGFFGSGGEKATPEALALLEKRAELSAQAVKEWEDSVKAANKAKVDKIFSDLTKAVNDGDVGAIDTLLGRFSDLSSKIKPDVYAANALELHKQTVAILDNKRAQLLQTQSMLLAARAAEKLAAAMNGAADIDRVIRGTNRKAAVGLGQSVAPDFNVGDVSTPGNLGDFAVDMANLTSGLGPAAKAIGDAQTELATNLKGVSTDFLANFSPDINKLTPNIKEIVEKTFANASDDFKGVLISNLENRIKGGIKSSDLGEIKKQVGDTLGASNKVWLDAFVKAKEAWFKNASAYNDAISESTGKIQSLRVDGARQSGERFEQRRKLNGREVTDAERERSRRNVIGASSFAANQFIAGNGNAQRGRRAQAAGAAPTTSGSISGIRQQKQNVSFLKAERRDALNAGSLGSIDGDLIAKDLDKAIDGLVSSLTEGADRSKDIAQVLSEYEQIVQQEKSKRESVQKSITDFAFATNEGRQTIQKNFASLNTVLASGSLESVSSESRGPVQQILQQFKDVALVGSGQLSRDQFKNLEQTFGLDRAEIEKQGGLTGGQVEKILAAQTAVNAGVISPEQAKQFFNQDTKTSREAQAFQKASEDFGRIAAEEREARKALIELERENQVRLFKERNDLSNELLTATKTIIKDAQTVSATINQDLAKVATELTNVTGILKNIQEIKVGGNIDVKGAENLTPQQVTDLLNQINILTKPLEITPPAGQNPPAQSPPTR